MNSTDPPSIWALIICTSTRTTVSSSDAPPDIAWFLYWNVLLCVIAHCLQINPLGLPLKWNTNWTIFPSNQWIWIAHWNLSLNVGDISPTHWHIQILDYACDSSNFTKFPDIFIRLLLLGGANIGPYPMLP